ncbi:MAG: hypothetical protein JST82_15935 [Bacteroidetes bacterium]|nr:hypothetical protein [Bacteroidota bacterium]
MVIKWIIIFLAVLNFGFMIFDGSRALATGDYIRPTSGTHAGQLGPWKNVVEKIGIDPESNTMKVIFVIWGIVGMCITIAFIMGKPWAWKAMIIMNVCSLWYAMMGTISSTLQIVLLIVTKLLQ